MYQSGTVACERQPRQIRTEHALQPHEAADVAVKVDVQMLVRVSHRYDVVQLVVEVKPFRKRTKTNRGEELLWFPNCILVL